MASATPLTSTKVVQRIPWLSLAGIMLVVLLTLGSAAANMLPHHIPTARELQRAEQAALIAARRDRIAALVATGDQCRPAIARELARALVFDGRSAISYADDYARRCGDDPIVRRWGAASTKLARYQR
jgi:hypothetical protein